MRNPSDSLSVSTRSQSASTGTQNQKKVNEQGITYQEAIQNYTFRERKYRLESAGLQALVKYVNDTVDPHHFRLYCKTEEEVKD